MAQGNAPLPCIDDLNSYQICLNTLRAKCPTELMIKELIGMKATGRRKKCMWVASYVKQNNLSIPRIESKQMIGLLQEIGSPEDGLLKIVGHSRLNNFECIFGEWIKINCKCGFFSLAKDNRDIPKHTTIVTSDIGPVTIPLIEFTTANSHKACIADFSMYPGFTDNLIGIFTLMGCGQWERAIIARDIVELCFVGRIIGSNAIIIGGVSDHLMLKEYLSKVLGNDNEEKEVELCFWIDDDLLELLDMYGYVEETDDFQTLVSFADISSITNQSMKNLVELFSAGPDSDLPISQNDSNDGLPVM